VLRNYKGEIIAFSFAGSGSGNVPLGKKMSQATGVPFYANDAELSKVMGGCGEKSLIVHRQQLKVPNPEQYPIETYHVGCSAGKGPRPRPPIAKKYQPHIPDGAPVATARLADKTVHATQMNACNRCAQQLERAGELMAKRGSRLRAAGSGAAKAGLTVGVAVADEVIFGDPNRSEPDQMRVDLLGGLGCPVPNTLCELSKGLKPREVKPISPPAPPRRVWTQRELLDGYRKEDRDFAAKMLSQRAGEDFAKQYYKAHSWMACHNYGGVIFGRNVGVSGEAQKACIDASVGQVNPDTFYNACAGGVDYWCKWG
jgi:hypothetical protein